MKSGTNKMIAASVMAALICIGTCIAVPLPFGYANLGDGMLLIGAAMASSLYAGVASGLGAALTDLMLGYTLYAPVTFVIKFLMGFTAAVLFRTISRKYNMHIFLGAITAEWIMVTGYYIYERILYDDGAAASVPGNCIQGVTAILMALVLVPVIQKRGK